LGEEGGLEGEEEVLADLWEGGKREGGREGVVRWTQERRMKAKRREGRERREAGREGEE
jgi:hypothetical protein